jgi:DNA primase
VTIKHIRNAALAEGYSTSTLYHIAKKLQIVEFGSDGQKWWRLPIVFQMGHNGQFTRLGLGKSDRRGCVDLDGLRDRINLEAVTIALLGPAPGRRGQRGGRLLWWKCPFHDDANPSFCVTPLRRMWHCFGCGATGDAVGLVMRLKSCPFPEAVRWLDQFMGGSVPRAAPPAGVFRPVNNRGEGAKLEPRDRPARSNVLELAAARALVEAAAQRLWSPAGKYQRGALYGRGLTDETIQSARLGYTPFVPELADRPGGIVIPWFDEGNLVLVKLRQPDGRRPKYREVYRNGPQLFPGPEAIRAGLPLAIVEGEFDALLLGQELEDLAGVMTLGSASGKLNSSLVDRIWRVSTWYIATDNDAAGRQAAASWPARAKRVLPPEPHKDWTEAFQRGIDLREFWLRELGFESLSVDDRRPGFDRREERAAIMEFDGGLTREAAERAAGLR